MPKLLYAILRFVKCKGPEIGRTEAHDERTKETYASNPDADKAKSHLNSHLIEPSGRYRAEAEKQLAAANLQGDDLPDEAEGAAGQAAGWYKSLQR